MRSMQVRPMSKKPSDKIKAARDALEELGVTGCIFELGEHLQTILFCFSQCEGGEFNMAEVLNSLQERGIIPKGFTSGHYAQEVIKDLLDRGFINALQAPVINKGTEGLDALKELQGWWNDGEGNTPVRELFKTIRACLQPPVKQAVDEIMVKILNHRNERNRELYNLHSDPKNARYVQELKETIEFCNELYGLLSGAPKDGEDKIKCCQCPNDADIEVRYTNVSSEWGPICNSCQQHNEAVSQDVIDHEMKHFGGAYGLPTWETRPLSLQQPRTQGPE